MEVDARTHAYVLYTHTQYIALTGHQTMLRPARKNPPTVPRLVEYIAHSPTARTTKK